jgi:deazaflavin-dependent oxidoreductase (nitroreductase family)
MNQAALHRAWRIFNPVARLFAGILPGWFLIETTGRVTGRRRTTPVASGPWSRSEALVMAVEGEHAAWVRNLVAEPRVRIRRHGRWHEGHASVGPLDPGVIKRFSAYARFGLNLAGQDPVLVRVALG